jgi:hypothetical protein
VTSLGNYCFAECSSLISLTFPVSLPEIGRKCFEKYGSLQNISFSLLHPPQIREIREKILFFQASADLFIGCPFSIIQIN